jgi:hypothetical protein
MLGSDSQRTVEHTMLEEATDLIRATLEEQLEEKEREQALAGGEHARLLAVLHAQHEMQYVTLQARQAAEKDETVTALRLEWQAERSAAGKQRVAELTATKAEHDAAMQVLQHAHRASVGRHQSEAEVALAAKHEAAVEELELKLRMQSQQLGAAGKQREDELAATKGEHRIAMQALQRAHRALVGHHDATEVALVAEHEEVAGRLKEKLRMQGAAGAERARELTAVNNGHHAAMQIMTGTHRAAVARHAAETEAALAAEHQEAVGRLEAQRAQDLATTRTEHEGEVAALSEQHRADLQRFVNMNESMLAKRHAKALEALEEAMQTERENLQREREADAAKQAAVVESLRTSITYEPPPARRAAEGNWPVAKVSPAKVGAVVGALEAAEVGVVGVDLVDFRVVAPQDWLGAPPPADVDTTTVRAQRQRLVRRDQVAVRGLYPGSDNTAGGAPCRAAVS